MARCPFCNDDIKEWDKKTTAYLIVTKHIDEKIHVHGTLSLTTSVVEMLRAIIRETGIGKLFVESDQLKK